MRHQSAHTLLSLTSLGRPDLSSTMQVSESSISNSGSHFRVMEAAILFEVPTRRNCAPGSSFSLSYSILGFQGSTLSLHRVIVHSMSNVKSQECPGLLGQPHSHPAPPPPPAETSVKYDLEQAFPLRPSVAPAAHKAVCSPSQHLRLSRMWHRI